jgi:hypothetical protein
VSVTQLINRPCTLILRGSSEEADDFGDEVHEEQEIETVWELQQQSAGESEEGVSETAWIAFFRPDEELAAVDAIRDPDLGRFELDGDPWPVRSPWTQQKSHIEVQVRRSSAQAEGS